MFVLPELVEAAARIGNRGLASDALQRLVETTQPAGTDFARGIESRCRAMVVGGVAAEERYQEAIELLGRTGVRTELARAHLLYGEWLRREGRRVDAREQLRTAHETVRHDRDGGVRRTRPPRAAGNRREGSQTQPETREKLTPQEQQIARLARDGLSNPEIGAQLFISAKTVEWHLGHVFTKLGISSRRQLRTALPERHSLVGRP